jgi:hypothetical protein
VKSKDQKKTLSEVNSLIQRKLNRAVSWDSSKLSRERERVYRYYNGELPKRRNEGSSSFVSNDVYDAVEAMKAQLLETFCASTEIVKFDPIGPQDAAPAAIATAWTKYVVMSQNDGYTMMSECIHDGLTARVGIVSVSWDERFELEPREFDNFTHEEVMGLVAHEKVQDLEADADHETGLYAGTVTLKIDKSQVAIENVNPEEFFIDPVAKKLDRRYFCGHRTIKTLEQLRQEGYDTKVIKNYNYENDSSLQMLPEVLARFQQLNTVSQSTADDDTQDALKHVLVFTCFAELQLKDDKQAFLYQVVKVGDHVLSCERVDDLPYLVFTPLPIPHAFYGNNFGAKVIPTQNVQTVLTRAVIDHTAVTVNPRWAVTRGGLTNPRELLDNRLGGIVNVTRPDAVTPLMQPNLNPFVFQTLEMVKAKNEETTGISSLSQGLNKDAISNQNSQGMVNDLVNLSQTRQKIIARNFGQFLMALYIRVYNLVIMHEKKQNVMQTVGGWVPVDPQHWKERKNASVSLHLGYGEHDREAGALISLGAMMTQNPEYDRMFTGKYKLAADVFRLKGYNNVDDYLTDPQKLPPPQPSPAEQLDMMVKKQDSDARMLTAQAQMEKVNEHSRLDLTKSTLKASDMKHAMHLKEVEQNRKVAETRNKIDVAQREVKMLEQATPAETHAIIAPH